METEEELQDELKDMPFGPSVKRSTMAPEGYFDKFPDQVMTRWLQEKENVNQLSRPLLVKRMSAAAAIVSVICLGITLWTNQTASSSQIDDISSGDAYQYIMENIDDFAPLFLQPEQWLEASETIVPDPSSIEEYLLEEMDGEEFESIF
ncbi:MAG: hypothetical protein SH808_12850 [Saprospiraceae bacterium]|nr:hypothetical protein [Saprospiraceae bacterium]